MPTSVRSILVSIEAWVIGVVSTWFAWAIAILTGLADAANGVFPHFDVPRPVLIAGYAAAFIAANVRVFHQMRIRAIALEAVAATEAARVDRVDSSLGAATAQRNAQLLQLGIVNPLVSRFLIRQFAPPLEHNESGWVTRVVIAPDCLPARDELRSSTKDVLKDALSRSRIEQWISDRVVNGQENSDTGWTLASPNTGYIVTFKRDWGTSAWGGSRLLGKVTLQLPVGAMSGPRIVLVLDVIERPIADGGELPRLSLSLPELHGLLHALAMTTVDQLASAVFPLVCEDSSRKILGPNYELSFGDRSLNNAIEIPDGFTRPATAHDMPWANINAPEDADAHDLGARDALLRRGIESMLRQNEYDGFEAAVAGLPMPWGNPERALNLD
jgi:hypothetical protein